MLPDATANCIDRRRRKERDRASPTYLAHVVPGLEEIAAGEIEEQLAGASARRTLRRFDERTSVIMFRYRGTPRDLLRLGTAEDVFALAAQREGIPADRRGLAAIRSCLAAEDALQTAVSTALQVRPRRKGKVTFRVIARKAGEHTFRRLDLQQATERSILERFPAWRLVEDNAQCEIWVHLIGGHFIAACRLSDGTMRQRTYRQASLPAALKPTIARAMVLLSGPQAEDIFLDPMCGSGTIVIERALAGRYRLLLGGDIDQSAVQATLENVGPRHKPIEIQRWDARRLPLEDRSISAIVTNLPFGQQIGTVEENRRLYPALLLEWIRVLKDRGTMVLLSSERSLVDRTLHRHRELVLERQVPVLVRGLPAAIYVVRVSR